MLCDNKASLPNELPNLWSSANELFKKCNQLEEVMNSAVGLLSGPKIIDEVETARTTSEAFDITRSKQALLGAIGNIVDLFTTIKLAYILDRTERARCGIL